MKLLIVDDNETNLCVLHALMSSNGYEVIEARNGAEALEIARRDRPDIIIADVVMPVMDGFSLCRECKSDERLRQIPFVFYTASYTDTRDRDFALSLGAERLIVKPAEPAEFVKTIKSVIEERRTGAPSDRLEDEVVYLREHNEALIRKLEDELLRMEHLNRAMEQDITERKQAERALQQSNEMLKAVSTAQSQFISDLSMRQIFDEMLSLLLSLTESEYGLIGEVYHDSKGDPFLKTHAIANIAWNEETRAFFEEHAREGMEFRNLKTLFGAAMTSRQPVLSNDPANDERCGGVMEDHPPLNAFLGLPFFHAEQMVGMVGIANRPGGYTEGLVEFLQPFLTTCASIIEAFRTDKRREQAEEALRESESRFRDIFDTAPVSIWVQDLSQVKAMIESLKARGVEDFQKYFSENPDLSRKAASLVRILDVNNRTLKLFGAASRNQLIESLGSLSLPESFHMWQDEMIAIAEGRRYFEAEAAILTLAGERKEILVTISFSEAQSDLRNVLVSITDITERKRAEEEIRSRARQQAAVARLGQRALAGLDLQDLMNEAVTLTARGLGVEYCKVLELLPGGQALLMRAGVGWKEGLVGHATVSTGLDSQAGFTLKSSAPVIVEDLRKETRFSGPPLLEEHKVTSGMSVIIPGRGKPFGVLGAHSTKTRRFAQNDINFLQSVANVLASAIERKRAEEEIRESRQWFEAIFEASRDGIVVEDDERIAYVNSAYAHLYGYDTPAELIGRHISTVNSPEDNERLLDYGRRRTRGEEAPPSYEMKGIRRNGSLIDLEASISIFRVGGKSYIVTTVRDIAERKRADQRLREAEQKYRSIIQNAVYGIYLSSPQGRFIEVNPALVDMLGYDSAEELMAVDICDIYTDPEERARLMRTHRDGQPVGRIEAKWRRKDGAHIIVSLSGRALKNEQGRYEAFEVIVEDITERRSLEDQLRHSQKMEAVGRLAGGVAHDFNNLLTAINGYADIILSRLGKNDPLRHDAIEISKAGKRAAMLTSQLLAFSRRQVIQPRVVGLNSIITDSTKMLRRLIGEDIELITNLDPALGHVKVDPGQIEQVIMNLAVNSRDAMPQGGRLFIETANAYLDESFTRKHTSARLGRYVLLSVSDTGCGMDEDTRSRIFEPFFTTKERGKGTGLGLSTVYGIVKQSGGHILVTSTVELGTAFKIYLPMVDEEIEQEAPRAAARSQRGSETILVVEDEEAVRRLVRIILSVQGYTVIEAASGREALSLCKDRPIDLLITDVVMPQMSGRELVEQISSERPAVKILYMSGYLDDAMVRHGVLDAGQPLLSKPFTPESLYEKVRSVLDG